MHVCFSPRCVFLGSETTNCVQNRIIVEFEKKGGKSLFVQHKGFLFCLSILAMRKLAGTAHTVGVAFRARLSQQGETGRHKIKLYLRRMPWSTIRRNALFVRKRITTPPRDSFALGRGRSSFANVTGNKGGITRAVGRTLRTMGGNGGIFSTHDGVLSDRPRIMGRRKHHRRYQHHSCNDQ